MKHQTPTQPRIRCAIYTRKSSEEGLEKSFNSLHAQREACEAYITSQAHEGWVLVNTPYDDGGFSGGTLERPALSQLLRDIDAGLIDLVLVYKVDRLSRSLADFVRLIERFDRLGISFVSVTQQFNTASSMGRLTLNVLLSFAQFEREVTGERIRDKIAASKKKGLWMGGAVPLGYDVADKQLRINPAEAQQVKGMFEQYLQVKCVHKLKHWCDEQGITSKRRITRQGKVLGGNRFTRGALYTILKNPLYIGQIAYKGKTYPGQHPALLDGALWQGVQEQLAANRRRHRLRSTAKAPSLLAGILFDDRNNPMSPSHAKKGNRRYCYYVSQAKLQMRPQDAGSVVNVSADTIDPIVIDQLCQFLEDANRVLDELPTAHLSATQRAGLAHRAAEIADKLRHHTTRERIQLVTAMVSRVEIGRDALRTTLDQGRLLALLSPDFDHSASGNTGRVVTLASPLSLKRSGIEPKFVIQQGEPPPSHRATLETLGRALLKAMRWHYAIVTGDTPSINQLARDLNQHASYIGQHVEWALLSPEMIDRIIQGNVCADFNLERLKKTTLCNKWSRHKPF